MSPSHAGTGSFGEPLGFSATKRPAPSSGREIRPIPAVRNRDRLLAKSFMFSDTRSGRTILRVCLLLSRSPAPVRCPDSNHVHPPGRTRDLPSTLDSNSSFRLVCFNHSGRQVVPPDPGMHSAFLDQAPAPIDFLSTHRSGQAPPPTRCPAAHGRRKNDERPKLASPRRPTAPLLRTPTSPPLGSSAACCTIPEMRDSRIRPLLTACEDCSSEDGGAHGDLLPSPGDADVEHCDPSKPAKAPCSLRRRCAIES